MDLIDGKRSCICMRKWLLGTLRMSVQIWHLLMHPDGSKIVSKFSVKSWLRLEHQEKKHLLTNTARLLWYQPDSISVPPFGFSNSNYLRSVKYSYLSQCIVPHCIKVLLYWSWRQFEIRTSSSVEPDLCKATATHHTNLRNQSIWLSYRIFKNIHVCNPPLHADRKSYVSNILIKLKLQEKS